MRWYCDFRHQWKPFDLQHLDHLPASPYTISDLDSLEFPAYLLLTDKASTRTTLSQHSSYEQCSRETASNPTFGPIFARNSEVDDQQMLSNQYEKAFKREKHTRNLAHTCDDIVILDTNEICSAWNPRTIFLSSLAAFLPFSPFQSQASCSRFAHAMQSEDNIVLSTR